MQHWAFSKVSAQPVPCAAFALQESSQNRVGIVALTAHREIEEFVTLNNGVRMPRLGVGVYQCSPGRATVEAVTWSLQAGYRLVDTARFYENERDVGTAIRSAGIPRDQVFVTTKLWKSDYGYDGALRAFDSSRRALNLEYVDLYLIHWPLMGRAHFGWSPLEKALDTVRTSASKTRLQTWKALETLLADGRCRAIGVSNFTIRHLSEMLQEGCVPPAVNQVEFTPFCFQSDLLDFCRGQGIQLEAYSPLTRGRRLEDPTLVRISASHGRSAAQILIRWALQHGAVVIPKSSNREHILENSRVFDFTLSPDDMELLNALDEGLHLCWNPTGLP